VREEGKSIKFAAEHTNDIKKNRVPRTTLNDRLLSNTPGDVPKLGRPTELTAAAENAIVRCLRMCAQFQYPMRKSDLQSLVQSYVVQNSICTR